VWHAIWHLGAPVGEKIVRSALVYGFLLVVLRVLGKRELGQSNTLDLLVLLLVANAVQNGIIGNDNSVTGAFIGAATLFAINRLFSFLVYRYSWWERLLEGTPTTLIHDHRIDRPSLKREEISEADLRSIARRQGFEELGDVREALLETNGTISMFH
jgi:uncharacterized membrane protein YcaP (DUF421 family)